MSNNKAIVGIDVGSKGFISLMTSYNIRYFAISDNDKYQLSNIFAEIKKDYPNVVCAMEEIHAIHNSSAKATFSFGEINGLLKGLLIANKIPYHLVAPKTWQAEMWDNKDKVYEIKQTSKGSKKSVNTKQTSFNTAKRLFPEEDLRRTPKCSKLDDNKCDSLLIAEYARRKNL